MSKKTSPTSSISTTSDALTVAENSGPTLIGIQAPTDTSYPSNKLVITITGLPSDGAVLLSGGTTPVSVGETLTVAQLTGLVFKPTAGSSGQTSTFSYKVTDPSGLSATGTATLAIASDTTPPTTTAATLTVAENAGAAAIGIAAPTDPNYVASQLSVTITGLPSNGTVLLSGGTTPVSAGETLTVAQLTGLMFKPTAGVFSQSSALSYKVSDPAGLSTTGTATLAIGPDTVPPTTTGATLTVAENAGATPTGITAPTDPNYAAAQLSVAVTGLPSDGTVLLSGGTTPVSVGETLTVAQLTGLMFKPTAGVFSQSSGLSYKVSDPVGLSTTGTATLAIGPDTVPPTTSAATLTVAENAGATPIGIATPVDPNYPATQLSVKVTGLPSDGIVLLSDGVTQVGLGALLTVAQLTALLFQPTSGLFGQSSTFSYTVTDPAGLSETGSATLTIGADTVPPVTTDPTLTVAPNSGATAIGIPAPTDTNYDASQLTVRVTGVPNNGTVLLSDGVTAVASGEMLTVAQLTGLMFKPTTGVSGDSSTFTYTVSDPAGLSAAGIENLGIAAMATSTNGLSPDSSTLTAGSGGNLVTGAGTWTFSATTGPTGYMILLNGQSAAGGSAAELEVANQGNIYAYNSVGVWYEWNGSGWVETTSPTSSSTTTTTDSGSTTVSPDGSTLTAGSGGSLVTSAGTWTFSSTTGPTGYMILLNGQDAGGGSAVELEVANQGNIYAYNSAGAWYEWTKSSWVQTTNPTSSTTPTTTTTSTTTTTTSTSATISPVGSTLLPGTNGSITTSAGTWTFGASAASSQYNVLLNGQSAAGGAAAKLEVASNGDLYAYNSSSTVWYEWINSNWTQATPPLPIVTTAVTLAIVGNSPATPIGIAAPSDIDYAASQLSVTINALPSDGAVLLSNGVTPISVGETLSAAQLAGLEFQPTANLFNQSSALQYTVTDPAGMTAQGNVWLSVGGNPSAIWHDPPSGAASASGIDIAPTVVQPSQAGDIVGVQLQNTGTTIEAAGYVTFGMVFLDAAVNPGTSLVARINGVDYAVQIDVKSTYADGSIEQAVLTLDAPAIPAGGTLDLMLAEGSAAAPSPAAPSALALLAGGYNVDVNFTFINSDGTTTTASTSAAAALQAAINAGTVTEWLAGSDVNEYDVTTTVDGGKLQVEFDIRAYANGTTTTNVIFSNAWLFSTGKTNLDYNVSISQNGTQVYSANNVQQSLYTMWDYQVASAGTINPIIQYDIPYLEATGAIQAYDTSYGVSNAAIQTNYNGVMSNTGPLNTGIVTTYMPSTGGRQDIGPQPNWTVQWLLSQNAASYEVMMANADASGSVPWHYVDESTGEPINGETYPNFGSPNSQDVVVSPTNGWPTYGANGDPWTPDVSHTPDLNYLAYLVTGSHYQLELLQAEADYAITSVTSYGETYDTSNTVPMGFAASFVNIPGAPAGADNISNGNSIRGFAWELRTVAEAAYITPDSDPMKSYFVGELDTAMNGLVQEYLIDGINQQYGQLNGFIEGSTGPGGGGNGENMAPWQEDFVVTSLAEVAGMNIPQASAQAVQMLQYMDNFVAGLFTNGQNGFNPLDGTAEWISVNANPSGSPYPTGTPFTSWSQLFNANSTATWQTGTNGVPTNPTELINWSTDVGGGYGVIAQAALADEITYTGSAQAIQAYGLVVSQIAYSFALNGQSETAAYQSSPEWAIMPRLPDGVYLTANQMHVDTSNAATVNLTATGGDALLAVVGSGTSTLTSDSGAGGCDLLYGGSGPTTLVAGAGNDYMFGGGSGSSYVYSTSGSLQFGPQQSTTFFDGTGNDFMYGGPGLNTYVFQKGNTAGARSTTIANFNLNTDELNITANIDGNGITTASQMLAGATVNNGNTLLHLSPNDTITLLGISQPSSLLNHMIVS